MILPWRNRRTSNAQLGGVSSREPLAAGAGFLPTMGQPILAFESVQLQPAIMNLSMVAKSGDWIFLIGSDDFAKALFCDLAFGYINPDGGMVSPALKKSDAAFLGRTFTTYGRTLLEHLNSGVKSGKKEWLDQVTEETLGPRFRRHLNNNRLEFREGRHSQDLELDERDYLELAEANVLLQRKRGVVIDTGSDLYEQAWNLGFRHTNLLLRSGVTIFWIIPQDSKISQEILEDLARQQGTRTLHQINFPPEPQPTYIN
jgi:hypothetical protein